MYTLKVSFKLSDDKTNGEGYRVRPEPKKFLSNSVDKLLTIAKKEITKKDSNVAFISLFVSEGELVE